MALGSTTNAAVGVGQHRRPFHHIELGAALVAVDRDPIALPGRVGIEGVAERRARWRSRRSPRGCLRWSRLDRIRPGRGGSRRTTRCRGRAPAAEGRLRRSSSHGLCDALMGAPLRRGVPSRVRQRSPLRRTARRRGRTPARECHEPPVHKIEVVRRLVNQQATGVGLVAVPAAEVVRAVGGVEHPFERDRQRSADRAVLDHP